MARILIIDDEPEMVRGLEDNLRFEGYQTLSATDGADGLALALREGPDLVLLDVMMPRLSGWDVLRKLRAKERDIPVIMLTARGEEADRVLGLELGADDYVSKPIGLRELLARFRAVLRRPGPRQRLEIYGFGEHQGEVVTRDRLLDEVWGYEQFPTTRTVDTHMLRLRQKLESDPDRPVHLLTVHGQGYRLIG